MNLYTRFVEARMSPIRQCNVCTDIPLLMGIFLKRSEKISTLSNPVSFNRAYRKVRISQYQSPYPSIHFEKNTSELLRILQHWKKLRRFRYTAHDLKQHLFLPLFKRGNELLLCLLFLTIHIILFVTPAFANPFKSFDLRFDGKFVSYHPEDLNDDGLQDLMLFTREGETETRTIWLFLQTPQGFRTVPEQSFKLTDDAIVFDFGDVVGDTRKELVFFTAKGIAFYTLSDTGYTLSPVALLQTNSLYMLSDKKSMRIWDFVRDLNGDSRDELLVPQVKKLDLYFKERNKWQLNAIPLAAEAKVYSPYNERFSVGYKTIATYSSPYLLHEDFDADGRRDLVGVYQDSLVVFLQEESGLYSSQRFQNIKTGYGRIWFGGKILRTHLDDKNERTFLMRVIDLNNDKLLDIVTNNISTKESVINPKTAVHIYFGKKDVSSRFYFNEQPDYTIHPEGTQMVIDIIDWNNDNKLDFVLPVVKIGLTRILKMLLTRSVEIENGFYLMNDDGIYSEKPDARAKMVARFSFKGGAASPVYELADFNGDGVYDILTSAEETKLMIYWGNRKNIIDSSVGVSMNTVLPQDGDRVRALDLNGDQRSDVVITYAANEAEIKRVSNVVRVLMAK